MSNHPLSRRTILTAGAALPIAATLPGVATARATDPDIVNPIIRQRADPQIYRHDNTFYFTGSVPEYDRIVLRSAKTVAGLSQAKETVLWRRPKSERMAGYIWAPEIHYFDGRWHIYFAAGDGDEPFHIRTYVLQADGPDPMHAEWSLLGQLETPWDTFTLDCTSFEHKGTRYVCWAQAEPGIDTNSNLYLAPLATPTTLAAKPARLSMPNLPWERRGFKVNEGPYFLARNGRMFITYSASATDDRYRIGMLSAPDDADPMDAGMWVKSPEPVFGTSEANHVYGPGHNSFVVDEKGRDLLVYHGRDYKKIEGDPLFDPNRHARVQIIQYDADGMPVFGQPVANGPMPVD
ncbi:family 43 glycosylhydrolase [Stakelama sp. CBK3Z-3]|uniref:Family 43 glycosylhydrolase n=1 Tax=Stakelama flava TaxID=2860338 RepID=A0ABS6XMX2_9SPHN|nr:family 43 glycosylhydrolase [Stakelama flava]MBW4331568.1 family 43 glycosylhydrolase [Stakelama flava]